MLESTGLGQRREEQAVEVAEESSADPAVMAAAFSVALSWYFFFVRGDTHKGLFVGLWPPTILAFASYFNQTRMSNKLEGAVRGGPVSLPESIEQFVSGR